MVGRNAKAQEPRLMESGASGKALKDLIATSTRVRGRNAPSAATILGVKVRSVVGIVVAARNAKGHRRICWAGVATGHA